MRRAALLVSVLAAGCAALAPESTPPRDASTPAVSAGGIFSRRSVTTADELVAYLDRIRVLNESALATEAARQRAAAQREGSDMARVKAALALALTHPAEEGDILALVDPVTRKGAADADLKAVASFLHALAGDRRRIRESATAAAAAKLRDERRATEAQKQRADALQERAAQLQQKLDALTEIEKSLSDRQTPSR